LFQKTVFLIESRTQYFSSPLSSNYSCERTFQPHIFEVQARGLIICRVPNTFKPNALNCASNAEIFDSLFGRGLIIYMILI